MQESSFKENTKLIKLLPEHVFQLKSLFDEILNNNDDVFFKPHEFSLNKAVEICNYTGKDLYLAYFDKSDIVSYCLLRGWDEGYDIPSLGIYISKDYRGKGLSKMIMDQIHLTAKENKAKHVRLTVNKSNKKAIELYKKTGYKLGDFDNNTLVGYFHL